MIPLLEARLRQKSLQDTDTDIASVFFRLNTDTDTSVFSKHTEYWILVLLFCTGQCSGLQTFLE